MTSFARFFALSILLLAFGAQSTFAQSDAQLRAKSANADQLTAAVNRAGVTRVIVRLKGGDDAATDRQRNRSLQDAFANSFTAANAARSARAGLRKLTATPLVALTVDAADLQALANDPQVETIWVDELKQAGLVESVPLIGMTAAPATTATGSGSMVAILDTGVDKAHPFLSANVTREACFSTTANLGNNAQNVPYGNTTSLCPDGTDQQIGVGAGVDCSSTTTRGCGHGSHVAGIAAGKGTGSPARGVAPDAKIFAMQVFTRFPAAFCTDIGYPPQAGQTGCALSYGSDQIDALGHLYTQVTTNNLNGLTLASANMSLGGGQYFSHCDTDSLKPSIDNLKSVNVATVIASGNNGYTSSIGAPGCISTAVTVGSTTKTDGLSSFSNSASMVDVLAPGSSITSAQAGTSNYVAFNGTSMATPHVAGAFAAIRSVLPSATVDQITNALIATGTSVTDTRVSGGQTKPRIRVDLALSNLGYTGSNAKAVITSPTSGNLNPTTTFNYTTGTGVSSRVLYVGTAFGTSNVFSSGVSGTSVTVSNIPAGTIHATLWSLVGANWEYATYTYTGLGNGASTLTSPIEGSAIDSGTTFTYTTGSGVTSRVLYVGTTYGASNIFSSGTSGGSITVPNIPAGTVHVTLWSLIGSTWTYYTYTFTGTGVAVVTSPAPSASINPTTTFTLTTGSGVTSKVLYVGTSYGASNIFNSGVGGTSVVVQNIPGGTIHVTLWSLIGSTWHSRTYTYNGVGSTTTAFFTSPALNSVLSTNPTFTWTSVAGASEYWIQMGSQFAFANYFNQSQGTSTSTSFSFGAGWAGQPLYTRLWTRIGSTWYLRDYAFYAPSTGGEPAGSRSVSPRVSLIAN